MDTISSLENPGAFAAPRFAAVPRRTGRGSPSIPAWPVGLLGVPFDHVTKLEAVARIAAMIATRRPHYVVTANVDFLVQAQHDVELRHILLEADLVLCDGTPLLWASRWLGRPLPERAAGADVVPLLIRSAADRGHRLFLLGAGPGVAADAAARLQAQHPDLVIAGHYSPPFRSLLEMDSAEIVRRVRAARPDLLLVSFGCPKQEKWIAMHVRQLGVPVLIGVGATLDFIAGRMRRAPVLMQRTGTEWLYRLAQEPRRLARRYGGDLVQFAPAIARQYLDLRRFRPPLAPADVLTLASSPDGREVAAAGDFTAAALAGHRHFFATALQAPHDYQLDLSQVRFLDSTGAALLVQWHRLLARQGHRLVLLNPSVAVQRILARMRLASHFFIVAPSDPLPSPAGNVPPDQAVIPPYPGGHTLGWQGELTAANVDAVEALTRQHLSAAGPPPDATYLIDLSQLRFIDSAGADLMGRLRAWARGLRHELRFLACRPDVRNVLHHAQLDTLTEAPRR